MPENSEEMDRLIRSLDSLEDETIRRVEKSINRGLSALADDLIGDVDALTFETGSLQISSDNVKRASVFLKDVEPSLQAIAELAKAEILNVIPDIGGLMSDVIIESGVATATVIDEDVIGAYLDHNLKRYNNGAKASSQVISDMLFQNISTRTDKKDFVKKLRATVAFERMPSGTFKRDGFGNKIPALDKAGNPLGQHAETWARSALTTFEGDFLQRSVDKDTLGGWQYAGTLILTSRNFCRARAGRYFTDEEIRADIASNPIGNASMSLVGGWNCRHKLIPVPKARFERQIAEGLGGTVSVAKKPKKGKKKKKKR
jgi:hypothetical protein